MLDTPLTIPGLRHFETFLHELNTALPERGYRWSEAKERSCTWMLDRVVEGRGVDVGGTDWLCEQLARMGREVTFYDVVLPQEHPLHVQDDMMNVLEHFAPGSLDFITTRHTLEHSVAPLFQLWCYNRLLRPDGQLLVMVPVHAKEWVWFHTHWNCLPQENWLMLFHRAGFRVEAADAGSWNTGRDLFIELRFDLRKESESMRLKGGFPSRLVRQR
ncbi:MAG: class I SAM-dependent methyltransferase, partial [Gemmatimonadaceae bacterium]|nr:class I SAM-dependent methyltransferase [Gemmatimonadaceae bacterium]